MKVSYKNLGTIEYQQAWDYQEELLQRVIDSREAGAEGSQSGYILLCEHPHVYTLGRSGSEGNMLVDPEYLKGINATFCRTNRGGDITYHGPGQIVAYPILDLGLLAIGVKDYVHALEQAVIDTLLLFGINSSRLPGASGVWLDVGEQGKERKICAIGVRVSRFVTMHGLALNVNTDLNYFGHINPCGFATKGVTSMQRELGGTVDLKMVHSQLRNRLCKVFNLEIE